MSIIYTGHRQDHRVTVYRSDEVGSREPLPPRNDLDNHSPDGFEWGYAGSGPAQLALAILADALGNDQRALRLHQKFKRDFVQNWDQDSWLIEASVVRVWGNHDRCTGAGAMTKDMADTLHEVLRYIESGQVLRGVCLLRDLLKLSGRPAPPFIVSSREPRTAKEQ